MCGHDLPIVHGFHTRNAEAREEHCILGAYKVGCHAMHGQYFARRSIAMLCGTCPAYCTQMDRIRLHT